MDRRVSWTEPAWSNLDAIATYIAQDSRRYAATFVREARDVARSLRHFANRGRVVPEIGDPTVRELFVFRRYRMLYRVTENRVYILALIHGARDLLKALEE